MIFMGNPTPFAAHLPYDKTTEVIKYKTEDGVELEGALIHAGKSKDSPIAIYFHGNAESAATAADGVVSLARAAEIDFFVADYRGYGGNKDEATESGLYKDGRAAVKATGRDPKDIVLSGWSLGTGVAVELANEGIGRSVVLMGPFTSIPDMSRKFIERPEVEREFKEHLGGWKSFAGPILWMGRGPFGSFSIPDKFDSGSKIAALEQPVFVVHGTDDEVCDISMGKELAEHAKHGKLYVVEGSGHWVLDSQEAKDAFREASGGTARGAGGED
jgi:pimeloyl-ACP methyl ester carboxylesterase